MISLYLYVLGFVTCVVLSIYICDDLLCTGSVLSGGGSAPLPEATAQNWVDMINEYQKGALASRLGIPMVYGIDAVHGHNNVYNATIFPHNVGLGATRQVLVCM